MEPITTQILFLGLTKLALIMSPCIVLLLYYLYEELKQDALEEADKHDRLKYGARSH